MNNKRLKIAAIIILFFVVIGYYTFKNQPSNITTPIIITKPAFDKITNTDQKKIAFFDYLSPYTDYPINRQILVDRQQLIILYQDPVSINIDDKLIQRLITQYQFPVPKTDINKAWLSAILPRVNVLSLPMVLTQAAMESSWGTSCFAREGNSYFGQWCFIKGYSIVALEPDPQNYYEVQKFSSTQAAVQAYFNNINTNQAYTGLRVTRATLQQQQHPINVQSLRKG